MAKTIEYLIKATDEVSPVFDRIAKKAVSTTGMIRNVGDLGDVSIVKKFGKNFSDVAAASDTSEVRSAANDARAVAEAKYAEIAKASLAIEREAASVDKARVGAMVERSQAAVELQRIHQEIDAGEAKAVAAATTRAEKDEARSLAAEHREAAERRYAEVSLRAAAVENSAKATDQQRVEAIGRRTLAARKYAEEISRIDAIEREAIAKQQRSANILFGAALVGGAIAATNALGDMADAADKFATKVANGEAKLYELPNAIAKSVPVLGGTVEKMEAIVHLISGAGSYERILADQTARHAAAVEKVRVAREGLAKANKDSDDLAQKYVGINDGDRQKIDRQAAEDLRKIKDQRDANEKARDTALRSGLGIDKKKELEEDRKLDAAEYQIRERRNAALRELDNKRTEELAAAQREMENVVQASEDNVTKIIGGAAVARLRDQKRELDARLEEIRQAANSEIAAIDKREKDLRGEGRLSTAESNAFDRERRAIRDNAAMDSARARQQAAKDNAQKILDITKQTLQAEVDRGSQAAEREMKRLDLAEKYKRRQEEIDETLKQQLTPEQRTDLLRQRAGLRGQFDAENVRKDLVIQGRGLAGNIDGRFQSQYLAQSSEVQGFRDQVMAAKVTAAKVTQLADAQKKTNDLLERLFGTVRRV